MLPYRTDEGLYLDDEGVLIPWGTPLKPDVPPRGAELRRPGVFEWKARRALGGIFGDIFAVLFPVDDPIGFPNTLQALHSFSMLLTADADQGTPRVLLKSIHDQFASVLGSASFSYPCYESGLPSIHWITDHIHHSCRPVGPAVVNIHIQHIPTEPSPLRAEWDRKHREYASYDARVPFVAWDHQDSRFPEERRRRYRDFVEHQARPPETVAPPSQLPPKVAD